LHENDTQLHAAVRSRPRWAYLGADHRLHSSFDQAGLDWNIDMLFSWRLVANRLEPVIIDTDTWRYRSRLFESSSGEGEIKYESPPFSFMKQETQNGICTRPTPPPGLQFADVSNKVPFCFRIIHYNKRPVPGNFSENRLFLRFIEG